MKVLIQNGVAHEIYPGEAPILHPSLIENIIEYAGPVEEGWAWDGQAFIEPQPAAPAPITKATKLALWTYLSGTGEWAAIQSLLDADQNANMAWLLASHIDRYHPIVMQFQAILSWTDAQVDDLFNLVGDNSL